MPSFLTVKEAARRTGKSPSSIRRIVYAILEDDAHPDRSQIEPSPQVVKELHGKGENFPWKISEELLARLTPANNSEKEKGSEQGINRPFGSADAELLSMLRRELDIKNQQIAQQSEMIGKQMQLNEGLSERLREGNILIHSLQQQLTLPAASQRTAAIDAHSARAGEGESSGKKSAKQVTKSTKPKRGLFSRLFR